jgi:archaellum biogenesis ATPase FlaH/5S rRNA maturation endonuclease (ribonuclease M5)
MSQVDVDTINYVLKKNWESKDPDHNGEMGIKECPLCGDTKWHFSINVFKEGSPYQCFKCSEKGNLVTLQRNLGDKTTQPRRSNNGGTMRSLGEYVGLPATKKTYKTLKAESVEGAYQDLISNRHNALTALEDRGIKRETIDYFKVGVTTEPNGHAGPIPFWSFPYWTDRDEVGLVKYRSVPPHEKELKREKDMESVLYNQRAIDYSAKSIVICEGEIDTMAVWQSGCTNVIGVSIGAKSFRNEWVKILEGFDDVVLIFDQDDAGREGRDEVVRRLGEERVRLVDLPTGMDANDVLQEMGGAVLNRMIEDASAVPIEGVLHISDALEQIQESLLFGDSADDGIMWHHEAMNETVGPIVPGTLIICTGRRGTGKTTLLIQNALEWARAGIPVLVWCGEMTPKRLAMKIIQALMGVKVKEITEELLADCFEMLSQIPIYLGYHATSPTKEVIETMSVQAYKRFGVKMFIIDNLLCISQNARDPMVEEGRVAQVLNNFCIKYDANVILVAHPRKTDDDVVETANDIKGNSNVINLASQAFTVFRKSLAPKKADDLMSAPSIQILDNRSAIVPLKARFEGGNGTGWLYFEGEYSRFREMEPEDYSS